MKNKRNDEDYSNRKQTYKGKRTKKNISRKSYAPKKTSPHQMKMNSVTVRLKEFYSWK
jgi:hypothetical protein